MLPPPVLATTDVGVQVAAYEGIDSNVFQTTADDGTAVRHPSPFTTTEGGMSLRSRGRRELHELRALGRLQVYTPSDGSFTRQDGLAGLAGVARYELDPRTRVALASMGTVGSVQATRATDAAQVAFDPFSTRRVGWLTSESATLSRDVSRAVVFAQSLAVDLGGTVRQDDPTAARVGAPVEHLRMHGRTDLTRALDARTRVLGAIAFDRTHSFYVIDRTASVPRRAGPIDSASITATAGVSRRVSVPLTASAEAGATVLAPVLREPVRALPAVTGTLLYVEPAYSVSASTGFAFASADPTLGPGASATAGVILMGRPAGAGSPVAVLAAANAARTVVLAGPNSGAEVSAVGASAAVRWEIAGWLGAVAGYDLQLSVFDGPTTTSYVRHLGFIGLSGAWSTDRTATPLATLSPPVVAAP